MYRNGEQVGVFGGFLPISGVGDFTAIVHGKMWLGLNAIQLAGKEKYDQVNVLHTGSENMKELVRNLMLKLGENESKMQFYIDQIDAGIITFKEIGRAEEKLAPAGKYIKGFLDTAMEQEKAVGKMILGKHKGDKPGQA